MDHRSASTTQRGTTRAASGAQENAEPVHVGFALKSLAVASGGLAKATDSVNARTLRRALHSIDSNRPRPVSYPPAHPTKYDLSKEPLGGVQSPVEVPESRNSSHSFDDALKAQETHVSGHKRAATTAHCENKKLNDPSDQLGEQESENLAWMDMMLALLEKRYGTNSSFPVCLTDLEEANLLQSPLNKRQKTIVQSRNSLDVCRTQNSEPINANKAMTSSSTNLQIETEQDKDKRQRLLRHAQQIQSSSVSSSRCCGCKTGCLKMYCVCFSSRGFCHVGCGCHDCKNGRTNQETRVEAIQNYLANDPRAFSFASSLQDATTTGFLHLLPQKSSAVVMRGCRCKKSKCLKKYCECFLNGLACTSHCRCMDCSNHSESTSAHHHSHLQRSSVSHSSAKSKSFHSVQILVTKQPRRNRVGKTLRLNL